MAQLQLANQQASAAATQGPALLPQGSLGSESPVRSQSQVGIASLQLEKPIADQDVVMPRADVLDWVAKAKESIEAFGGYIRIGTASVAKNMIGDSEDSMDSDDEDGDEDERLLSTHGSEDEGEGASIVSDDREPPSRHVSPEARGRRRDVVASSEKPATIPSHVAPFGLMANLVMKTRSDADQQGKNAERSDEIGVARKDYFRAGTSNQTL